MLYDHLPIFDGVRRLDPTTLVRLMDALTLIRQVVRIKHCYKIDL
jgi:hypothetical protein